MLETCRKHCLEQDPSFFLVFGYHLMGFRKLGFILVIPFMRFVCNFWVQIEGLMFEDGNLIVFVGNAQFFWPEFFFSSLKEPGLFSPWRT